MKRLMVILFLSGIFLCPDLSNNAFADMSCKKSQGFRVCRSDYSLQLNENPDGETGTLEATIHYGCAEYFDKSFEVVRVVDGTWRSLDGMSVLSIGSKEVTLDDPERPLNKPIPDSDSGCGDSLVHFDRSQCGQLPSGYHTSSFE